MLSFVELQTTAEHACLAVLLYVLWHIGRFLVSYVTESAPKVTVEPPSAAADEKRASTSATPPSIACFDPATLGVRAPMKAASTEQVRDTIERARVAQREWSKSDWATRRRLLRTMVSQNRGETEEDRGKDTDFVCKYEKPL